ncbi:hypothetical protein Taro_046952 [Colocasia esculenta]|uniref:Association with the SNF1 complex (ASC) domain-containing protein n=1 Tax=Colocasia esculenta TaxID=4460 RepID=A0A843X657_COLES|nr:hypothetical protein [Colocasia esculenta]
MCNVGVAGRDFSGATSFLYTAAFSSHHSPTSLSPPPPQPPPSPRPPDLLLRSAGGSWRSPRWRRGLRGESRPRRLRHCSSLHIRGSESRSGGMGNASGKEEGEIGDGGAPAGSPGDGDAPGAGDRGGSAESMGNTPPESPGRSRSPLLFASQVPVIPLQRAVDIPVFNPSAMENSHGSSDLPPEKGIPTMITWNFGGNNVAVEGSWDNWTARRVLERSGKDHSILLVLPSGVYQYRFIVDGEWRYTPDLPSKADETGRVVNLLDVHDYVPDNLDTAAEFESPPSPDSSYGNPYPVEDDFAKEPAVVPPQLHLTVLGGGHSEGAPAPAKPQHVVLNHLFIEKGWTSQSLVALGLTHRFQSKYVTVVLYKPLKR